MDRYAVETHPNPQMATFHFTRDVPEIYYLSSQTLEPDAKELKDKLLQIPGVVEVTSRKQAVSVTRGGAYRWDHIEDAIVECVCGHLGIESPERVGAYE